MKGLESTIRQLKHEFTDYIEVLDMIDGLVKNPRDLHVNGVDNIHATRPTGTSRDRALRKLRADLSPHAEGVDNVHTPL